MRLSYSGIKRFKECAEKFYLSKDFKVLTEGSSLAFGKALDEAQGVALEALAKLRETSKDNIDEAVYEIALNKFHECWHTKPVDKYTPKPEQVYGNLNISYYQSDFDKHLITDEAKADLEERFGEEWDMTFASIKDAIKAGKQLEVVDQELWAYANWWSLQEKGAIMLWTWVTQFVPDIEEVVSVQEEVSLKTSNEDEKIGYIDAVLKMRGNEKPIVYDFKTSARRYESHALVTADQLVGYLACVGKKYNTDLVGYCILLKAIKKKKTCDKCGAVQVNSRKRNCEECPDGKYTIVEPYCEIQTISRPVTEKEINSLLQDDSNVLTAVKNNVRFKNSDSCMNYNRKCDFYSICWEGKDPKDINHLEEKNVESKKSNRKRSASRK